MEVYSHHLSDGQYQSAAADSSPSSIPDDLPSSSVPLTQEDRRRLTVIPSSSSCPESRGARPGIDQQINSLVLDDDSDFGEFQVTCLQNQERL